jgi:MYXO-CTERM domain-containing protein
MSLQTRARGTARLAVALGTLVLGMGTAQAHILLADPKPRDNNDEHKNDAMPCPTRTAAQPTTTYKAGAMIPVKFNETTNHPGCFTVEISAGGDAGWMMLGSVKHSAMGRTPRPYETMVALPAGMAAKAGTLRVIQYMLRADPAMCPPPPPIAPGSRYYQCANVVIEEAAGGTGGASGSDGGAPDATPPADSGTGGATGAAGSGATGGARGAGGSSGAGGASGSGGAGGGTGGSGGSGGRGGAGGSSGKGGSGGDGGEGGEGGEGGTGGDKRPPAGGCSVGGSSTASGLLLLLAVVLPLIRRRRR